MERFGWCCRALPYARWPYERERLVTDLADVFDVSPTLARYRLEDFVRKSLPKLRATHRQILRHHPRPAAGPPRFPAFTGGGATTRG